MARLYYGKKGELRIYSGSNASGVNFFFRVAFAQMDLNAPMGRPRPDQLPITDRGVVNQYAHYIQGSDDIIMQPVNVTFTANLDTEVNRNDLIKAMSNPLRASPWTVGSSTWVNTNGTTQIYNGCGSLVSTPLPDDPLHDRVNLAIIWRELCSFGTVDTGFIWKETWFQPNQINIRETETAVQIAATGFCYGPVSQIASFPAGTFISGT